MSQSDRSQWMKTLEIIAAKPPDEAEAEWAWVMKGLGLGPEYFLGIHEAVRQGRWREAENPGGYLKAAARREQSRLTDGGERKPRGLRGFQGLIFQAEEITLGRGGSVESHGESFSSEDMLESLEYRQASGKSVRDPDGVWRTAAGGEADPEGLLSRPAKRGRRPRLMTEAEGARLAKYAERIRQIRAAEGKDERDEPYIEKGPEPMPDWPTMAAQARLSDWEQRVVEYKMRGIGWREAWAEQADDLSRRALRAAWRKLERTGLERLEAARKKSFPQNVAEQGGNDTE
jgi:hypothetical protein